MSVTNNIILSFDVGIKNLAYCLYNEEDNKIIEWDIINLLEDKIKESKENNNCSFCKAKAKKYCKNTFYCGRHFSRFEKIKETTEKCECCGETKNCYLFENTFYCKKHFNESNKLSVIKKVKCKKVNNDYLFNKIINSFDTTHSNFLNVKKVIIELQPARKNPRMIAISNFIMSYFLIKGKYTDNSVMKSVEYISSKKKLRFGNHGTTTYKQRKNLGIDYVREYLKEHNTDFLDKFNSSKKKDDLCDALLQVLYTLNLFS